jgi:hypothetical protein
MKTIKRINRRQLFIKTIEIVQPLIGLADWKIAIRFPTTMKSAADCQAYPEYKQAGIRGNLTIFKRLSHYEIVQTAIHEMVHCVLWPLVDWTEELCKKNPQKLAMTRKLEEATVTEFEKMLTKLCITELQSQLIELGYAPISTSFAATQVVAMPPRKQRIK